MKITLNGNIYEVSLQQTHDLFAPYISGADYGLVVAIGQTWPHEASHTAIENSLRALGYGTKACTYIAIAPPNSDGTSPLDAQALYTLIEGLDPVCIIVLDEPSAQLVSTAYRHPLRTNTPVRLLGRDVVVFGDLEELISTPEGKQQAWALLKTLPKYSS